VVASSAVFPPNWASLRPVRRNIKSAEGCECIDADILPHDVDSYFNCVVLYSYLSLFAHIKIKDFMNKKQLKNVGPIRHCEPPHALILHCYSLVVASVTRRLRIDVHNNNNNNDNA